MEARCRCGQQVGVGGAVDILWLHPPLGEVSTVDVEPQIRQIEDHQFVEEWREGSADNRL
jgi:hypothetical protein